MGWAVEAWKDDAWFGTAWAVQGAVAVQVHPPGTSRRRQKQLQRLIIEEDELLLAVITAFLHVKDE